LRVQLLHFALFRDAVGRESESRELPEGTRICDLWEVLKREHGALRAFAAPPAAVNRLYVGPETVLSEGDEVAFLPPVAGG
jgi:molybdopterin converting factor small subunit